MSACGRAQRSSHCSQRPPPAAARRFRLIGFSDEELVDIAVGFFRNPMGIVTGEVPLNRIASSPVLEIDANAILPFGVRHIAAHTMLALLAS